MLRLRRPANPIGWLFAASGLVWSLSVPPVTVILSPRPRTPTAHSSIRSIGKTGLDHPSGPRLMQPQDVPIPSAQDDVPRLLSEHPDVESAGCADLPDTAAVSAVRMGVPVACGGMLAGRSLSTADTAAAPEQDGDTAAAGGRPSMHARRVRQWA